MDWEGMFAKKKSCEDEENDSIMEVAPKTPFSRKPLQDVNERVSAAWGRIPSFKSPEKTLEHIEDSQDSGISFSPSRHRIKKLAKRSSSKPLSPASSISKPSSFDSVEEDMDVGDVFDEEQFELPTIPDVPNSIISSLLCGQIKNVPIEYDSENVAVNKENFQIRRAIPRRLGFHVDENTTPTSSKTYELFKRPGTPGDIWSPSGHKRIKSISSGELPSNGNRLKHNSEEGSSDDDASDMDLDKSWEAPNPRGKTFLRSQSESAVSIMKAVERIDGDSMLIGDASKRYVLPVISHGKHKDLKEITPTTLVKLLNGEYNHVVETFEVIDCRYPYEYEGGHIKGAINIHTQKQLHERYLVSKESVLATSTPNPNGRHILLFHCEFSSQRAPDLCRFLREADRKCNSNVFPNLHYPELYIIHGGYKAFFESYKEYCDPQTYLEMADPRHMEACRLHKSRSKTEVVPIKSSAVSQPKPRKPAPKKFCI